MLLELSGTVAILVSNK